MKYWLDHFMKLQAGSNIELINEYNIELIKEYNIQIFVCMKNHLMFY